MQYNKGAKVHRIRTEYFRKKRAEKITTSVVYIEG